MQKISWPLLKVRLANFLLTLSHSFAMRMLSVAMRLESFVMPEQAVGAAGWVCHASARTARHQCRVA